MMVEYDDYYAMYYYQDGEETKGNKGE